MDLEGFNSQYRCTGVEKALYEKFGEVGEIALKKSNKIQSLLDQFAGASFDSSLFRVHNKGSFYYWTKLTFEYFKKYKGTALVFGFDWMGRQFALNERANKSVILMLDPATAKAFELEALI